MLVKHCVRILKVTVEVMDGVVQPSDPVHLIEHLIHDVITLTALLSSQMLT